MKKTTIIRVHLIFWVVMIILIFPIAYYLASNESHGMFNPFLVPEVWILTLIPLVYLLFPFYFSYAFITGCFVKYGFRIKSLVWIVLFIVYYAVLLRITSIPSLDNSTKIWLTHLSLSIILTVIFGSLGSLFNIIEKWYANEKVKVELKKKNLRIELDLLKSRMNPHFLFNTINNIDVLIEEDPKKASQYLKKLSGILRFVLYKADTTSIPLQDEIQNIYDYLELQKIRTLNNQFIHFEVKGDVGNHLIAPLLFIPYIENAFKYSNNKKVKNAIDINLDVSKSHLLFTCRNHFDNSNKSIDNEGGLGNELMKQRLNLLYRNKHMLTIDQEENWYNLELKIELDDH
jgi:sensor histidine kinase YesM